MKTLVVTDLHLGTAHKVDLMLLLTWMDSLIEKYQPERLILAGDTFELLLPAEHSEGSDLRCKSEVLQTILSVWNDLFVLWRRSRIHEIIFLTGEHDYD